MSRQELLVIVMLLIGLGTAAALGVAQLREQRTVALAAAEELAEARRLAERIQALRSRPARAGVEELELNDLTRLIERAAATAGIEHEQLIRIWPAPPRRVGDSLYQEISTQVLLRHCTLEQLTRFLILLSEDTDAHQLRVAALRLSAPPATAPGTAPGDALGSGGGRGASGAGSSGGGTFGGGGSGASGGRWSVDVTLSYLIYAPREEVTRSPRAALLDSEQRP